MKYFSWWVEGEENIVNRIKLIGYEAAGLLAAIREQLALEDSQQGRLFILGRGNDMRFVARFFDLPHKKFMKLIEILKKNHELLIKDGFIYAVKWEGHQERFFRNRENMRDIMRSKRSGSKKKG